MKTDKHSPQPTAATWRQENRNTRKKALTPTLPYVLVLRAKENISDHSLMAGRCRILTQSKKKSSNLHLISLPSHIKTNVLVIL